MNAEITLKRSIALSATLAFIFFAVVGYILITTVPWWVILIIHLFAGLVSFGFGHQDEKWSFRGWTRQHWKTFLKILALGYVALLCTAMYSWDEQDA